MNTIDKVLEFSKAFDAKVSEVPTNLEDDVATLQLRISLMFEELKEFCVASGKKGIKHFSKLCKENYEEFLAGTFKHIEEGSVSDMLDALCDMRVVNDGTILACGMQEVFEDAFNIVHESNMSKACTDYSEALYKMAQYKRLGVNCEVVGRTLPNGKRVFIILRDDNKVLKGNNFVEPNFNQLLNNDTP